MTIFKIIALTFMVFSLATGPYAQIRVPLSSEVLVKAFGGIAGRAFLSELSGLSPALIETMSDVTREGLFRESFEKLVARDPSLAGNVEMALEIISENPDMKLSSIPKISAKSLLISTPKGQSEGRHSRGRWRKKVFGVLEYS